MLIRHLRKPNVKFTTTISSYCRALRTSAQASTPNTQNTTISALSTPAHIPRIYPPLSTTMDTNILPVNPDRLGNISFHENPDNLIGEWSIEYNEGEDAQSLSRAAKELASTDVPVAFPTETVYGLGADATRSSAVRAIFAAKGRPADNPLIVHVHSIPQLQALLLGKKDSVQPAQDPIPEIYRPLIKQFWPGPLTIIVPNPKDSVLAPEVTAGLDTFGARMPRSILALALIRLSGVPLAGPSANASTRPSPTAAEHVKDDLEGRIHTIVDGGPCEVGVESTVVDGLSSPPTILRPGGVTVEQLRQCPGWENVVIGYKDAHEKGIKPRAPGMKYRHYSPKATVVLYEAGAKRPESSEIPAQGKKIGIIRTTEWPKALGLAVEGNDIQTTHTNGIVPHTPADTNGSAASQTRLSNLLRSVIQHQIPHAEPLLLTEGVPSPVEILDINLGAGIEDVARGLFSALRELDKQNVDIIYVEGINDKLGDDIAAAVMNRLRKAAEIRV